MIAGILVSAVFWSRLARREPRLLSVYIAALCGAFLGAKLVYVLAEGWLHFGQEDMWLHLATGKTILGALLGGFAAVEIAKRLLGYRGITGDWFALIAPMAILLGRVGCLLHGCCLGKECAPGWFTLPGPDGIQRWPAVPVEILFNLAAIAVLFFLRRNRLLPGQHFHLYLIAYGTFRFGHEFFRATPPAIGEYSGYHFAALGVVVAGMAGFYIRRTRQAARART
jgi:phosphatidylglycerol---prolipoprotein diacylglyceryl transferase